MTDGLGRRIDDTYDGDGNRLTEKWYSSGGSLDQTLTFTYDADNNLLTAQNNAGTVVNTYDEDDRLKTSTDIFGVTLTFSYDAGNNRTGVQDAFGGVTTLSYDLADRLATIQYSGQSTQLRFDYAYSDRNEKAGLTRYSNVSGATKVGATSLTYDAEGRLTNLKHQNAAGTWFLNTTYTFDSADRLSADTTNGSTTSYSYDANSQVTAAGASNYAYDPNGTRNSGGFVPGAGNQLTTDGTWTYTYDAAGNETKKSKGASAETWTFGYDQRNHLLWAKDKATDGGTLLQEVDFVYDPLGRRVERDFDSNGDGSVDSVERYAYDGSDVIADLNGSSALVTRRLYGADAMQAPEARVSSAGAVAWTMTDRLGSVEALSDGSGVVQSTITYDAFGKVTSETNSGFGDRYKYTGQQLDTVTGFQHQDKREYDAATERWLSTDPMGFGGGDLNLYRYVSNNSTDASDPTGQFLVVKDGNEDKWLDYVRNTMHLTAQAIRLPSHWSDVNDYWAINIKEQDYTIRWRDSAREDAWFYSVTRALTDLTGSWNIIAGADGVLSPFSPSDSQLEAMKVAKFSFMEGKKYLPHTDESELVTLAKAGRDGANFGGACMMKAFGAPGAEDYVKEHEKEFGPRTRIICEAMGVVVRECLIQIATAGAGKLVTGGAKLVEKGAEAFETTRKFICPVKTALKAGQVGWQIVSTGEQAVDMYKQVDEIYEAIQKGDEEKLGKLLPKDDFSAMNIGCCIKDLAQVVKAIGKDGFRKFFLSCFAAGTPLLTPNGERAIESLKVGDLVLSRWEHDANGPVEPKVIIAAFSRMGRILHLHVGGEVIRTTAEHPFYVANKGWRPAGALQLGDLLQSHDGRWTPVEEVFDTGEHQTVYNVCVDDWHTYFVGARAWVFSAWAHNTDCQVQENYDAGKAREDKVAKELARENPGASVQRERYLRDAEGTRIADPLTGEARRVDMAVVKDGKVKDMVEVTSMTAPKADQIAKEQRIREMGDAYIRDRQTGALLPVNDVPTRLVRRQ